MFYKLDNLCFDNIKITSVAPSYGKGISPKPKILYKMMLFSMAVENGEFHIRSLKMTNNQFSIKIFIYKSRKVLKNFNPRLTI